MSVMEKNNHPGFYFLDQYKNYIKMYVCLLFATGFVKYFYEYEDLRLLYLSKDQSWWLKQKLRGKNKCGTEI